MEPGLKIQASREPLSLIENQEPGREFSPGLLVLVGSILSYWFTLPKAAPGARVVFLVVKALGSFEPGRAESELSNSLYGEAGLTVGVAEGAIGPDGVAVLIRLNCTQPTISREGVFTLTRTQTDPATVTGGSGRISTR